MMLEKPIKRESVVNIVLQKIKDALMRGDLKPGDKLPTENEFSEKLNIGRTTVREAMKMLKALGVIEVRQGDGTYVVDKLNSHSINPLIFSLLVQSGSSTELVDLRYLVEVGYTKLAIKKMSDEDLKKLRRIVDDHKKAINKGEDDLGKYETAFHYLILESTHNPFVIEIGKTVLKLFETSIKKTSKSIPNIAIKHHELILNAIEERNPDKVEAAIDKSFEVWCEHVKE